MAVAKGDSYSAVAIGGYVITPLAVKGAFNWDMDGRQQHPGFPARCLRKTGDRRGWKPARRTRRPRHMGRQQRQSLALGWQRRRCQRKEPRSERHVGDSLSSKQWTWMGRQQRRHLRSKRLHCSGSVGNHGRGCRRKCAQRTRYGRQMFTDAGGNLWLFGGWGYDAEGNGGEELGDLWKLSATTKQWEWVGGKERGSLVDRQPRRLWRPGDACRGKHPRKPVRHDILDRQERQSLALWRPWHSQQRQLGHAQRTLGV